MAKPRSAVPSGRKRKMPSMPAKPFGLLILLRSKAGFPFSRMPRMDRTAARAVAS